MQNGGNKVLSNEQLADGLTGGGGNQAVVAAINNLRVFPILEFNS